MIWSPNRNGVGTHTVIDKSIGLLYPYNLEYHASRHNTEYDSKIY